MSISKPTNYEWWVDVVHDCLCQISEEYDQINPRSNACRHICDETAIDLSHFLNVIRQHRCSDIPSNLFKQLEELASFEVEQLLAPSSHSIARAILLSEYFQRRQRWLYSNSNPI